MIGSPVVDSHFHVWDLDHLRYPWLDNRGALNRSYSFEEYLRDAEPWRVDGAVYCECTSVDYRREVQYVIDQAKLHPQIKGAVSWVCLEDAAHIDAELERMRNEPLIRGVRRMLKKAPKPEELCLSKPFIDGMRLLPKYGLIYDLGIVPCLMEPCYEMMKQCPNTKFVVEHCAEPDILGGGFSEWAKGMEKFSRLPNVCVKVSGFMTHVDPQNWTVDDMRPYFELVIEKFGYGRVMYGSDWPPVNQTANLRVWLGVCEEVLRGEPEENKRRFFRETAVEFYGLNMEE